MDNTMSLDAISINLSWRDRLIGLFSLIVAYIVLRCLNLEQICKILGKLKSNCTREINMSEADIAWGAVRKSSFILLGRAACIELSLAFVLFAMTKGLSSTWCVGVSTDPIQAHSWVEVDGKAFREGDNFEQFFRALLMV